MFNAYDIDCDGEVDFVDYIRTLSVTERGTMDEKLKWAFSMYDINGDGQVSLKEATEFLTVSSPKLEWMLLRTKANIFVNKKINI